ncbi:MAG: PKD domain-containing protein, partial [Bacteroidales bacterium]
FQFTASGGFPPYSWKLKQIFHETESHTSYTPITGTVLHPDGILSGFAEVPLPFSFPFFGKNYDTLYMHVNGYILFDKQDMPYYYLLFDENYLHQIRAISGYMNHDMGEISVEDNISYSSYPDSTVFYWRTSANEGNGTVMFSTTLYPDGRIRHHYGPISAQTSLIPVIGLGDGTPDNTLISRKSGIVPAEGDVIIFTPSDVPASISMSSDGMLSVHAEEQDYSDRIVVQAVDSQRIFKEKTIVLTSGIEIRVRPKDSLILIQPGDVTPLLIEVINHGNDTIRDIMMDVRSTSLNCIIPGNDFGVFDLLPGQNRLIDSDFSLQISDSVSRPQSVGIDVTATTDENVFHHFSTFKVDMSVIDVMSPRITDGNNNQLEAGEKASLIFKFCNFGKVPDGPFTVKFSVDDPFVGISGPFVYENCELNGYGIFILSPVIQINTEIPGGRLFHIVVDIYKSDSLLLTKKFELEVGKPPIVMYDLSKHHNTMAALAGSFEAMNTNFDRFEALDQGIFTYDIAFLSFGYGTTTYYLTPSEDSLLVDFLDHGGKLYAEAGFYFLTNSMLRSRLKINYGLDAIDFHPDTIVGRPDTPLEGIQFDYRGIATYILNLLPLETAVPWLTDKNSGLNFTVANDAGIYRTIASSINFDGFFPFESPDRKELLYRYLTFLGYSIHPLAANFSSDTRNICKGSLVHFEPACGGEPISWHWTFEGGSPDVFDGPNPTVTYENEGVYGVSLTVSDGVSENSFTLDEVIAVEDCSAIQEERTSDLVIYP